MFDYTEYQKVDYRDLLFKVDQLEVWSDILGTYCELHSSICNSLRVDRNPNCWLSWGKHKSRYIVLNDYSNKDFHGMTIFDALMYKHNLSFYNTCQYIYQKFILRKGLTLQSAPLQPKAPQQNLPFHLSFEPYPHFIPRDMNYWKPLYISSTELSQDGVYSVYQYRVSTRDRQRIRLVQPNSYCYAYTFPSRHLKIHNPTSRFRFVGNVDSYDIGWLDRLPEKGDTLFICKSYKDAKIQKKLGFENVIFTQGETFKIPDEILADLFERFNVIYIYYDNDLSGRKGATELAAYANELCETDKFKPIWLREDLLDYKYNYYLTGEQKLGITDNGDYVPIFGLDQLKKEINSIL